MLQFVKDDATEGMETDCITFQKPSAESQDCKNEFSAAVDASLGIQAFQIQNDQFLLCLIISGPDSKWSLFLSATTKWAEFSENIEEWQKAQDLNTFIPYKIRQLVAMVDFAKAEGHESLLKQLFYTSIDAETTRDREEIMRKSCEYVQKLKDHVVDLNAKPLKEEVVHIVDTYCELARRGALFSKGLLDNANSTLSCEHSRVQWPCESLRALIETRLMERKHLIEEFKRLNDVEVTQHLAEVVVVIGAGPIGLLHALQARLTGASVFVFEGRAEFTRLNVMAVSEYKEALERFGLQYLREWGAYMEEDETGQHFISASNAQRLLARVAAAHGITIFMRRQFLAYCPPEAADEETVHNTDHQKWFAIFKTNAEQEFDTIEQYSHTEPDVLRTYSFTELCKKSVTTLQAEGLLRFQFDLLVGAEGTRSRSRDQAAGFGKAGEYTQGPFQEKYMPMMWTRALNTKIKGAVVASRSFGAPAFCHFDEAAQEDKAFYSYTFDYQARDADRGYCWKGFILKEETATNILNSAEGVTHGILQELFPGKILKHLIYDQRHKPHAALFDVPMYHSSRCAALHVSSGGHPMALLLAGDAAITPWFPISTGTNYGAKRAYPTNHEEQLLLAVKEVRDNYTASKERLERVNEQLMHLVKSQMKIQLDAISNMTQA